MLLSYNAALAAANLLDYEDLLSRAVSVLKVAAVQQEVSRQYAHILVDEFQVRDMTLRKTGFATLTVRPFRSAVSRPCFSMYRLERNSCSFGAHGEPTLSCMSAAASQNRRPKGGATETCSCVAVLHPCERLFFHEGIS